MNRQRMLEIADQIEREPRYYNQREYGDLSCGTPGCIVAWAVNLFPTSERDRGPVHEWDAQIAAQRLDITKYQAHALFSLTWPMEWLKGIEGDIRDYYVAEEEVIFTPSPKGAVHVLRRLGTGDLDLPISGPNWL